MEERGKGRKREAHGKRGGQNFRLGTIKKVGKVKSWKIKWGKGRGVKFQKEREHPWETRKRCLQRRYSRYITKKNVEKRPWKRLAKGKKRDDQIGGGTNNSLRHLKEERSSWQRAVMRQLPFYSVGGEKGARTQTNHGLKRGKRNLRIGTSRKKRSKLL